MNNKTSKKLEDYRYLTKNEPITVKLTQDQQAMILKTYDYGLNALTDVDEMLLSAVIRQMREAIQAEH